MNAAIGSIIENLREIKIVTEKTPESFNTDRIQTSNGREFTIQEFVSRYFPVTYNVKKGPIHSLEDKSSEMDCVILAPNHPVLTTPVREVIIAEGVHAAIELKPDISNLSNRATTEIKRALTQIKSVKNLHREVTRLEPFLGQKGTNKYFDKIPSFIFSFVSKPAEETIKFLLEQIQSGTYKIEELPDFIVTLDHGIIVLTPFSKDFMYSETLKEYFDEFPDRVILHFKTQHEETLALFLALLYSVSPPEILISDFILQKYFRPYVSKFKFDTYAVDKEEAKNVMLKKK